MSFAIPTRRELAHHEAGHAYAFASIEFAAVPHGLVVEADDAGNHRGRCARQTIFHDLGPFAALEEYARGVADRAAAKEAVIALAGPLAELRFGRRNGFVAFSMLHHNAGALLKPDAFDVDGDFAKLRRLISYVDAPDPCAGLRRACGAADAILHAHWRKIGMLARRLDQTGEMGEAELEAWFRSHPAKRWADLPSLR